MKSINRRKAINYIYKAIAGSTGVFIFGINARSQKPLKKKSTQKPLKQKPKLNRNRVIMKKTLNEDIKAIKVLLENNRRVFANEYGRITPVVTKPVTETFPEGNIPGDLNLGGDLSSCMVNFSTDFTQGIDWCTGTNVCNGQGFSGDSEDENGCFGTNVCNNQTCDNLSSCDKNACRNQDCGEFNDCPKNIQTIVSADLLDRYKTDPYVELLFQEFNVITSKDLVSMLEIKIDAVAQGVR